jgi:hypothetical protein
MNTNSDRIKAPVSRRQPGMRAVLRTGASMFIIASGRSVRPLSARKAALSLVVSQSVALKIPRTATPHAAGIATSAPVVIVSLLCALLGSATPARSAHVPSAARPREPERAWISAKGFCCFPLVTDDLPKTGGQLADSMNAGWKDVFTSHDPERAVDFEGGRYPAVDQMRVDLSHAVVNPDHKLARIGEYTASTKSLAVEHFEMVAEPMVNHKSRVNLEITGTQVRLDLQHDKDGKPMLMLADAREGTVHFDVSHDDLQKLVLAMCRYQSSGSAVTIRSTHLDMQSLGPRSLLIDLHLSTIVGFIPAGMRFTARMDVDDRMNATISNLDCQGDEALGPLIAGFIRPAINKYNNTTRQLISFPSGQIHLNDVQIQAGEHVELDAKFSR